MKLPIIIGIILIILGVLFFAIDEIVIYNGGHEGRPISPIFSMIILVGGVILVIFGSRIKPKQ